MYLFYKIRIRSFSKAIEIDFNPFNRVDKINVYVIINIFFLIFIKTDFILTFLLYSKSINKSDAGFGCQYRKINTFN